MKMNTMKNLLLIVPTFLVVGFVVGTVNVPAFANAQESAEVVQGEETVVEPAGGEDELTAEERQVRLDSEARQAMLAGIATQLAEVEREALRLSLLVMRLELEEQALALEQQLQQALAQGGADVATAMPVPGSNVPEMVVEETAVAEEAGLSQFGEAPAEQADLGVEESVNAFASEEEVQGEEEEGKGFLAGFGPLSNLGAPELAALAILVFLVAFTLLRRLRRGRKVRPSSMQSVLPSAQQPLAQSPQGILQEGREDLKEKIAWE
ncbi:MAG: hypothetical protein A2940_01970 [Candidatus Wildermuthbacteria bacterium RIFCSPLOWO2_01_FULL_48_29]|uniref:Uncharacterized protein n=1 Tax=Candidatus Wildermuthbacteria bacterium RIFCSPLOWO2_01_FULL_48_29 TaxID=1802462 RepID=A0A1G2RPK5_9BACT|nr:MAG: hypothetical protein A2940_01970 [Candidatus Wildermuthbacteria bacterium RIFCSPLOWO2_01_FULL_48_29]